MRQPVLLTVEILHDEKNREVVSIVNTRDDRSIYRNDDFYERRYNGKEVSFYLPVNSLNTFEGEAYGVLIILDRDGELAADAIAFQFLTKEEYWLSEPGLLDEEALKSLFKESRTIVPKKYYWYKIPIFVNKLQYKMDQLESILDKLKDRDPKHEIRVPLEDINLLIGALKDLQKAQTIFRYIERKQDIKPYAE